MSNIEIIANETDLRGITEQVDTFAGWKRRGYVVSKGQKAVFKTKIWKPCKVKEKDENGEERKEKKLILVNAAFFTLSQVEAI